MLEEKLFSIPEYPEYLVNRLGEVFSGKSNKFLKLRTQTSGYLFFSVYIEGKQTNLLLHRVLARLFLNLNSLDSLFEVDHINSNKKDNTISNLQVLTKSNHRTKTVLAKQPKHIKRCNNCKIFYTQTLNLIYVKTAIALRLL